MGQNVTANVQFSLKEFQQTIEKAHTCDKNKINETVLCYFYQDATDPTRVKFGQGVDSDSVFMKRSHNLINYGPVLTKASAALTVATAFSQLGPNTDEIIRNLRTIETVEEMTTYLGLNFVRN